MAFDEDGWPTVEEAHLRTHSLKELVLAHYAAVRKFLKTLGVTAQREIELAVREQLERSDLQGDETLDATATVTVTGLSRDVVVTGTISLA